MNIKDAYVIDNNEEATLHMKTYSKMSILAGKPK